ncbi:MAG: hypothetical protein OHK006_05580 [Thermodesulfovibrionales bacterium]
MPSEMKKRSRKSGLPPGSLIHVGREREAAPKVDIIDYSEHSFLEETFRDIDSCALLRDKPTVTWTNIDGIQDVGLLEKIGGCFGLHPLVMEDILHRGRLRHELQVHAGTRVAVRVFFHLDSDARHRHQHAGLFQEKKVAGMTWK